MLPAEASAEIVNYRAVHFDFNRRDFVKLWAAGMGAVSLPRPSLGQNAVAAAKIADNVTLITGAGNNIVVLASDGGSLLVDCGDTAHAQDVLKPAGSPKIVIDTHWHLESTGGNDIMAAAGAKLVSSVNTQLWMTQEIPHDWEKKVYPPRAKQALPTETFYDTCKMTFAGEPVECGMLPMAHTDGDIYVHFMRSNVLVAGDAVQPGRLPLLDWRCDGWISGMEQAHRTLLGIANETTRIVPGAGPVMSKADLQKNLDTVSKIRTHLVTLVKMGMGPQDMIEAKAMKDFQPQLAGDPDIFLYTAYRGLWAHARELGGIV